MYWIIFIGIMLVSWIVQFRFKSKFKKYSEMPLSSGLSGAEIAQKMLNENGINDVQIISVEGQLTDHYNPSDKTVNLSPDVYYGRSASAAAVEAVAAAGGTLTVAPVLAPHGKTTMSPQLFGAQLANGTLASVGTGNAGQRLGVVDAQTIEDGLQRVAGLDALVVDEGQRGFYGCDAGCRCGQGLDHALEQDVGGDGVGCNGRGGHHAHQRQPGHASGDPGAGTGEEMGRQIG